tara:strand:+ start:41 stop:187 length:147 start_codon:yes stop_codon:yes gene_type:complete
MVSVNKKNTTVDKASAEEETTSGMSVRKAANKFRVAPSTVSRIKKQVA